MQVALKYKKDTKGTYVFESEDPASPIPTLYIKKAAFKGTAPASITVSVVEAGSQPKRRRA